MFSGHCHCGNIQFSTPTHPEHLTECNCSICHRYGVRWAYYKNAEVSLSWERIAPVSYSWGDKMIRFWHCPECGCVTHYSGMHDPAGPNDRLALNARMAPRDTTESLPIRHFDGADSFTFID